ncbi:MAG TPA: hypothetical protein VFS52_15620 [Steroidobacteraceae bacterium]|jgi:hypothetical protein|nr:hypothetical protein [Steroidobacteraceae bacterium]
MGLSIRYKVVGGREGEDLCLTEMDVQETLTKTLERYTKLGCRVTHIGDEYLIEDSAGDLVATYEIIH